MSMKTLTITLLFLSQLLWIVSYNVTRNELDEAHRNYMEVNNMANEAIDLAWEAVHQRDSLQAIINQTRK